MQSVREKTETVSELESSEDGLTFLLKCEVLCQVSTFMVASQHEERVGVEHLERPQVQHALTQTDRHTRQLLS